MVLSRSILSRIFSKDDKNIQLCMVDHGVMAGILRQRVATLDEACEEVALCVGKVILGEILHQSIHALTSHVRRIRHHRVVLRGQQFGLLHQFVLKF